MRASQVICLLFASLAGFATGYSKPLDETAGPGLQFLPGPMLFSPLVANPQEPRVGLRKEVGTSRMKLDIGSSLDLLGYSFDGQGTKQLRFGAEFFTYALTTSAQGLRLQVDAVDGFFGGYIGYHGVADASALDIRLRLLHLSAHFLDGHIDPATGGWRDNRAPLPFTKDFGELLGAYTFNAGPVIVMAYSGFSYATLVRPTDIRRIGTLHGFELRTGEWMGPVFNRPFVAYLADNLTFMGIPDYVGTNVLELGVKFGAWERTGVRVYVNWSSGLDFFSQYYNVRSDKFGVGFAFDVR